MQKILIALVLVVCSASAKPNLNSLVGSVVGIVPAPPAALTGSAAAAAIVASLDGTLGVVTNGVTIQFPDGQLTLGSVALPSLITCQVPIVKSVACHICNLDCVYVHNTYGGSCTLDPFNATKGYECVCQGERNDNGTVSTPAQVCGPILPGIPTDTTVDLALQVFLETRQLATLCLPLGDGKYNSVGCNTDCQKNHQYAGGVCQVDNTIPFTATQTEDNNGDGVYCICSGKSTDIVNSGALPTINAT